MKIPPPPRLPGKRTPTATERFLAERWETDLKEWVARALDGIVPMDLEWMARCGWYKEQLAHYDVMMGWRASALIHAAECSTITSADLI